MCCGFRTQLSLADFGKSLSAWQHSEGSQGESQRTSLLLLGLPFMCPLQLFSVRACMYMCPCICSILGTKVCIVFIEK